MFRCSRHLPDYLIVSMLSDHTNHSKLQRSRLARGCLRATALSRQPCLCLCLVWRTEHCLCIFCHNWFFFFEFWNLGLKWANILHWVLQRVWNFSVSLACRPSQERINLSDNKTEYKQNVSFESFIQLNNAIQEFWDRTFDFVRLAIFFGELYFVRFIYWTQWNLFERLMFESSNVCH